MTTSSNVVLTEPERFVFENRIAASPISRRTNTPSMSSVSPCLCERTKVWTEEYSHGGTEAGVLTDRKRIPTVALPAYGKTPLRNMSRKCLSGFVHRTGTRATNIKRSRSGPTSIKEDGIGCGLTGSHRELCGLNAQVLHECCRIEYAQQKRTHVSLT